MLDAQQKVLENTIYYLENYLNPKGRWSKNIFPKERINRIRYAEVDWKTVSDYIKAMDYKDFLKTPYWKAISDHAKYQVRYRCQICNSTHRLVTHHRNYAIHGQEHAYLQELLVICNECHTIFHNRILDGKSADGSAFAGIVMVGLMIFFIYYFISMKL